MDDGYDGIRSIDWKTENQAQEKTRERQTDVILCVANLMRMREIDTYIYIQDCMFS